MHVAGTKGKGSTIAYLEAIVRAAGWRTGAYTQPHLHTFRERIRLDGSRSTPAAFAAGVDRLRGLVEQLAERHPEAGAPTTFELTTVLAVLLFAEAGVDLVIAEVGLGGRLDATNALDTDLALIARIGLDHRQILGRTLAEIAGEKVAIARPGQRVLSARQRPAGARRSSGATARRSARSCGSCGRCGSCRGADADGTVIGRLATWRAIRGSARAGDAAGGRGRAPAAERGAGGGGGRGAGAADGLPLTPSSRSRPACEDAWLPARLELARLRPRVLIDAAHNVDSARALADELRRWRKRPLWLVLGILRDKDAAAILRVLLPLADGVVVVTPTSPRALPADALAAACRRSVGAEVLRGVVGGGGDRSGTGRGGPGRSGGGRWLVRDGVRGAGGARPRTGW